MADQLSDSELRKKLKEHGFDAGPITDSTRYLYLKKLDKLLSGQPVSPAPSLLTQSKSESSTRRRSTPYRNNKLPLSSFSSEDSESENVNDSKRKQNRRRTLPPLSLYNRPPVSPLTVSPPLEATPLVSPLETKNKKYTTTINDASTSVGSYGKLTRSKIARVPTRFESDFSDGELHFSNNHNLKKDQFGAQSRSKAVFHDLKDFPAKTFRWLSSSSTQVNNLTNKQSYLNGHQFSSKLNKEFRTEDDPKSTANYSQFISWLLVAVVAILFVTVGLLYIGVKQKESSISTSVESFSKHLCKGFSVVNCIGSKDELKVALQMSHLLHTYLSEVAGHLECNEGKIKERWVPLEVLKGYLIEKMVFKSDSDFEDAFYNCLILIRDHSEWGIKILQVEGNEEIRALESVISKKSLHCRISQAFNQVFRQIILAVLAILSISGLIFSVKHYRQLKKQQQHQIYRYVERAVEILQKHHDSCQGNPKLDPRLAIVHVRDMIIPLHQRSAKNQLSLWEKAVSFINENESRMRVETQRMAGEDFVVWRWLPLANPEEMKKSKIWQGEAFEKGGNILGVAPTPCLKIRNMFDPEVEYGEDWPTNIQDAILDKCEGNKGIVHIKIDILSKEGCVYIKCNSLDSAAQAYKALHGSWFDGNLVTVKYLRVERYHDRFPESRSCTVALTPSNNKRLSLQSASLRKPTQLENL